MHFYLAKKKEKHPKTKQIKNYYQDSVEKGTVFLSVHSLHLTHSDELPRPMGALEFANPKPSVHWVYKCWEQRACWGLSA